MNVTVYDIVEKRDGRYTAIGIFDDSEESMSFIIVDPEYIVGNSSDINGKHVSYKSINEFRLYMYEILRSANKDNLYSTVNMMVSACLDYGGFDINPKTGNWRAFL